MRATVALSSGLLLFSALPARAQLEVDEVSLGAVLAADERWFLGGSVDGTSDITAAALTLPAVPGGPPPAVLELECQLEEEESAVQCDLAEEDEGEFASLAELLQTYPAGDWTVSVNDGALTATLAFDPVAPDGPLVITSPEEGETNVSSAPELTYTQTCTNCDLLIFELFGLFPSEPELEYQTVDLTSPGSVFYSDWEGSMKPQQLPDGLYAALGGGAVASVSTEIFDQGPGSAFEFEYLTGSVEFDEVRFTVPEPAGVTASLAALTALGLLAAARRRHI